MSATLWRAEYDPGGGYRIMYTPDPANPPKRCGRLWRATFRGARRRAAELNGRANPNDVLVLRLPVPSDGPDESGGAQDGLKGSPGRTGRSRRRLRPTPNHTRVIRGQAS